MKIAIFILRAGILSTPQRGSSRDEGSCTNLNLNQFSVLQALVFGPMQPFNFQPAFGLAEVLILIL